MIQPAKEASALGAWELRPSMVHGLLVTTYFFREIEAFATKLAGLRSLLVGYVTALVVPTWVSAVGQRHEGIFFLPEV